MDVVLGKVNKCCLCIFHITFCNLSICPRRIVRFLIQVFTGILAVSLVALGAWYGVEDQPERRIIAVWSIDKYQISIDKYDTYDILFQTIGSQVLSKQAATEFRITISNA
jgi:hypothetical protein